MSQPQIYNLMLIQVATNGGNVNFEVRGAIEVNWDTKMISEVVSG